MRARDLALSLSLGLLACRPEREAAPPEPDAGADTGESGPATCAETGERFRDLDWIPADTRFVAWVEPEHPEFEAAARALGELAQRAQSIEPALPIYAATDLSQLGFELSSLSTTLSFGGFSPTELVKLHGPEGIPIYVWPSTCDLDVARDQAERAFGVSMRKAVDGMVGTPGATEFPFDVLLLRGDRAAFVPRDKAALVLDWLAAPPAPTLTGPTGGAVPRPGPRLRELEPAPFRILLQGRSLVAGEGAAEAGVRTLRATAAGVEIDGSLASP